MFFCLNRMRFTRRWRWWSLLLAGFLATAGLSLPPAQAQLPATVSETDPFCIAQTDPIADPVQGRSYGDPHINTFDGLHYSFQMAGEFILTRGLSSHFEVQARQKPVANRDHLSLNSAVAMNVCGYRVAIYAQDIPDGSEVPVWVDGVPTVVEEAVPLPAGGEVQRLSDRQYAVLWPSGDQVVTRFIRVGGDRFLNIMPILSRTHGGTLQGLLGNFNRSPEDDLASRDGQVVPAQSTYSVATNTLDRALPAVIPVRRVEDAYFDQLYRQFGDSWRVRPEASLFDYAPGQSTATFTDRSFPREFVTLNRVAPARLEAALNTCRDAGVDAELMDGCVFDVATTGQSNFATAAANAVAQVVVQELTDRVIDEVIDNVLPGLPF